MTRFQIGDRVAITVDAPPNPAGTPGIITSTRTAGDHGLIQDYGVVLDHDTHQIPGSYTADELTHLPGQPR